MDLDSFALGLLVGGAVVVLLVGYAVGSLVKSFWNGF